MSTREERMVPRAEPRSYYGQPILKQPVWTWEVPCYMFVGGLAGASAGLAWAAELRGNDELARRSWAVALAGVGVSPALLISDLGRPGRFLNMLRMVKVTSPMSVGSWLLAAAGGAIAPAALASTPIPGIEVLARPAKPAAALLGLPLATYTAALVSNTAVPVWHEARRQLPFVFAAGSAASAGAVATLVTPPSSAGPARRLALAGAAAELVAVRAMKRSLGDLDRPYLEGTAGRFARAAQAATAVGALKLVASGALHTRAPRLARAGTLAGAGLIATGALLERWAVYKAGFASAADPSYTVGPQRDRLGR